MNLEKEVFDINLEDIITNQFQPREVFDEKSLEELAKSIKEHGVIQPIIVRKNGDKYEIVAGERRYRASQIAGLKTIPSLVREVDELEIAKIALLENLQRKDLTPIEEARAYNTILVIDQITQEELAETLGKSQSTIANKLRLLNLYEPAQLALLNEEITERHARALLNVEDPELQEKLVEKIKKKDLTVKQLESEIKKLKIEITENNPEVEEYKPVETINPPKDFGVEKESLVEDEIKEDDLEFLDFGPEETPVEQDIPAEVITNNSEIYDAAKEEDFVPPTNNFNSVYDLRFAINNVRQAIQNTEKFGFKINTEEFDFENVYQITIKIDKNN